jgi:acetolactate synthase-1/2/3 large subunit
MLGVPVCVVVLDNSGWISIKGGQQSFFGRTAATDFLRSDGSTYSPDFAAIGRAFGLHAGHVRDPDEVGPAVARALGSGGPSLVSVTVNRELDMAGPDKTGWWDVPVPEYHPEQRAAQLEGRAEEQG